MKKTAVLLIFSLLFTLFSGCSAAPAAEVAASTMPVAFFARQICQNTGITVTQIVTEEVSCLHDYTLTVSQMKSIEGAQMVILSGAGLEVFMDEALDGVSRVVDASHGVSLLEGGCHHHHEDEDADNHEDHSDHDHEIDSHIWLDPDNALIMARNICVALTEHYPEHQETFEDNFNRLCDEILLVKAYGAAQLSTLSNREIITFHDGFGYLAHAFDLEILEAIEEESGSEPSARELIHLIETVEHHGVCALFVEENGSSSAASVISRETGIPVYTLTMAMSGNSWIECMYHNIDTLKEALK